MTNIVEDRVVETSTTIGTGPLTLAGAITGFRAFSSVMAVADTCNYMIEAVDASGTPTGAWEVGFATYSAAATLTRTLIYRSSNANAAVNFAAGTKRVMISVLAGAFRSPAKLFLPPKVADFTLFSGDGSAAVLTDDADVGLVMTNTATTGGIFRGGTKAVPAVGTDFVVIARILVSTNRDNYQGAGIVLYESGTGKGYHFMLLNDVALHQVRQSTNSGTYTADTKFDSSPGSFDCFIKIERVGTTLKFMRGADGKNWALILSTGQTTYFTTAPDRIGPTAWMVSATYAPVLSIPYWSQNF